MSPILVAADIGQDIRNLGICDRRLVAPGQHRVAVEILPVNFDRALKPIENNPDQSIRSFGQNPFRMNQGRHVIGWVTQAALLMTGGAEQTKGDTPFFRVRPFGQSGLVVVEFGVRFVRSVHARVEAAAIFVQESHAPKGQHGHQDEQPDRSAGRAGGRFDFPRSVR